jgi:hypothetical protein
MASRQPAVATPTNHPLLGPSVSIADDRARSRGNLLLGLACLGLGPVGVLFGSGDLAAGATLLGFMFAGGGAFLFVYGAFVAFGPARRLRYPEALVVGRDGFQLAGDEPVGWEEVAAVSDPASPPGEPRIVRVQLIDSDEYVARHRLGLMARQALRMHGYDLFLGRDMAMPVAEVEALMRRRLAEYRRASLGVAESSDSPDDSPARPSRRKGRRPLKRRR